MQLLRFYALLLPLITGTFGCETRNGITKKIKTGYVDITTKGNRLILNIRKFDGSTLQNVLYTKSGTLPNAELQIDQDCEILTTCVKVGGIIITRIKADPSNEVIKITRTITDTKGELIDCYKLASDTDWFSGPQAKYQHWPIQKMYFEEEPYVPSHPMIIGIVERYWLTSKGMYIFVDDKTPLFLDQNNLKEDHLCLIAKNKVPYRERARVSLDYEIGVFNDPRKAHEYVIAKHFGKPTGHPNERMVTHPVWSTWARYKVNVNDAVIRKFASEILDNGFNNSQIEIDDNWETCYGSAMFDPVKFPNVPKLVQDLKQLGFKVTLWIHPFINENCNDVESYDYAKNAEYFVRNTKGEVHTTWWQGNDGAGAIDFTNPKAVEWWVGRLKKIQDLGIGSFKFDAGEGSWLPKVADLTGPEELQPGLYTLNYTTNLGKHFDDFIEARVGWRSQTLPYFIRMLDKDTRWTWNNGFPTLITTLLQMNLNGYIFVLPDMVGGNGYVGTGYDETELPAKDMFIRWLQANVFMPSIQYSFVPWDFDEQTITISKKFTTLHADISPKIMELMKKAVQTGAPVNPPIWWVDPLNVEAHKINDQFLLGEEILVAPVIEENAVARDIYLPAGKWQDANYKKVYAGPMWLRDFPAPIDILPYFIKI